MRHLITYMILAAASLLLTACHIYDDYMYGPDGEQKVRVSFVLALGSSEDPFTRAETWHPDDPTDDDNNIGYDPKAIGDSYDNMIDPGTLQVVFYRTVGDFVGKVDNLNYRQVGSTDEDRNLYEFTGTLLLDEELADSEITYKMMVFANMPETQRQIVGGGAPVSSLDDLKFTRFDVDGLVKDTDYIPMWGVKTVELNLSEGSGTKDLGTVYVLRAMAKVEVKLSEALSDGGYTLTSMTMNNLNAQGYCLPAGAGAKAHTELLDLVDCMRPFDTRIETNIVSKGDGDTGKSLVMYVPEYTNVSSLYPATIGLTLQHNDNGVITELAPTSMIEFKNYGSDGKPKEESDYNIIRNHNYVFEITGINAGEDGLKFLVAIEDLELGGRYGFEY